jgi:dipeptidyl aminopeptidase/acylaminoacyl peptidase
MRLAQAALLASSLAAIPAHAFAEAVTVRDLTRVVKLSDPQIAPDGRSVVLVEQRADLDDDEFRTELVLVDVGTHRLRVLTHDRHHAGAPRWSPNGDRLAFTAPDTNKKLQLYVLPMAGGDALQVTHVKDGIDQFAWSPDGRRFAFAATDPAPERHGEDKYRTAFQVGDDDFTTNEKPRPSHVWIIAADGSGTAKRLTSGSWSLPVSLPPGPPSSPLKWTPDGQSLVIVRQETPSTGDEYLSRVQVLDVATGAVRDLTGEKTLEGYPNVSPDGGSIAYWRARDGKAWQFQDVFVAPTAGGPGRDVTLTLDKNIYGTWWMGGSKSLLVGANDATTVGFWVQPLDGSEARRLDLGAVMPSSTFWIDGAVGKQDQMAFVGQTGTDPYELYWLDRPDTKPVALTNENASLGSLTLGRTETFHWTGPGGRALDGVLTRPAGVAQGQRVPLVLVIHGGPNSASRDHFNLLSQALAAHGWLVFEPNYRGGDNADNAFYASIYKDAGQGPGEDVMSGVKALQDQGLADPSHMAVTGWSYGGYMTSWLIGHYPVWRAAVAGAAITDWGQMYDLSDGNVTTSFQVGGSPYLGNDLAAYEAQSPDTSFQQVKTPTLVLCDVGDYRVPITQSYRLFHALKDNGVETAFYAYPVSGHFPSDPVRQMDVQTRWIDWVAGHIGK